MTATIEITRKPDQDASAAAKEAADNAGTRITGNLRWYGAAVPTHRECMTIDGRTIRVNEPYPSPTEDEAKAIIHDLDMRFSREQVADITRWLLYLAAQD